MRAPAILLALLLALPAGAAEPATPDTTGPRDLLERLQREDDSFYDPEVFAFDESFRDSVVGAVDSLGMDAFEKAQASDRPYVGLGLGPGERLWDYNRVEGFVIAAAADLRVGRVRPLRFHLEGGYATSSKKFRHESTVTWQVAGNRRNRLWLGGLVGSRATSYGTNDIVLNGVRALVGGSDDQDYVWRQRARGVVGFTHRDHLRLRVGYEAAEDRSIPERQSFGIFSKMNQPNAPIAQGFDRRVFVDGRAGDLSEDQWQVEAAWSVSGGDVLGGDFRYNRGDLRVDARHYLGRHEFVIGVLGVATGGDAPVQRVGDVGGLSTVRGHDRRTRVGKHAFAARLEYLVPWDLLGRTGLPLVKDLRLQFVPWADAGRVWEGTSDAWLTSAGLGVQYYLGPFSEASYLRLDVAAPMGPDRPDDVRVYLWFTKATFF